MSSETMRISKKSSASIILRLNVGNPTAISGSEIKKGSSVMSRERSLMTEQAIPFKEEQDAILLITNKHTRYKLHYGEEFRCMLEPRDQVLEHQFSFQLKLDLEELKKKDYDFQNSQIYQNLLEQIHDFLLEAASNVVSASFKFVCKGELSENEAKEYAAKNLMVNIQAIFREVTYALKNNIFIKSILEKKLQEISERLITIVDDMLKNILVNLADLYPQAKPTGGTLRMRKAIIQLNRMNNEANDLILSNEIKIGDYMNSVSKDEDYTKFIMQVINTAIKSAQNSESDSRQRSVGEIFNQFNEKLFWLSQQDNYHQIIHLFDREDRMTCNKATIGVDDDKTEDKKHLLRQFILMPFLCILERKKKIQQNYQNAMKKKITKILQKYKQKQLKEQEQIKLSPYQNEVPTPTLNTFRTQPSFLNSGLRAARKEDNLIDLEHNLSLLLSQFEAGLEKMKEQKNYAMGAKIPAIVKQFSRVEKASSHFFVKHSSILRIMTKWAENLLQIFEDPEKNILKRDDSFKTIDNQMVNVTLQNKKKLTSKIQKQFDKVKQKWEVLFKNGYTLMNKIFMEEEIKKRNVSRYSHTRQLASKINAILTHLMLNYLNILIHHLLQAGRSVETDQGQKDINLIVFRVCDLLRSKLQCTERSFISLIKTLNLLDSDDNMKGLFRIIRVKNKLDLPANNIIINYLFMGKVACQLQLSIQEPKGKDKCFYTFSHFIYELSRGKFGPLAECSIMISSLDPMITASTEPYYREKQEKGLHSKRGRSERKEHYSKDKADLTPELKKFQSTVIEPVFKCSECCRLVIRQSTSIFEQDLNDKKCNCCMIKENPEINLKEHLKINILEALERGWFRRALYYSEIPQKMVNNYTLLAEINSKGKLVLYVATFIKEQLRWFFIKLGSKILKEYKESTFDYTTLNSIDITKDIKTSQKKQKTKENIISARLLYFIDKDKMGEVAKMMGITGIDDILGTTEHFLKEYRQFRSEKVLIKSIKFKSQNVKVFGDELNFNTFLRVIQASTLKKSQGSEHQIESKQMKEKKLLKYKKYSTLDLSGVTSLQVGKTKKLTKIPVQVQQFRELGSLSIETEKLESITSNLIPSNLSYLSLRDNSLTDLDLAGFNKLTYLDVSKNQLTSINFANCSNLSFANLMDNQFTSLIIQGMKVLSILNLSENKKLKALRLNLPSLKDLLISDSGIEEMDVKSLTMLNYLDISGNRIAQIDLSCNQGLKRLILDRNRDIKVVRQKSLPHCQNVSQSSCNLNEIPLEMFKYANKIILDHNLLAEITLAPLFNLNYLSLKRNLIKQLHIQNLPKLEYLYLDENPFSRIIVQKLPLLKSFSFNFEQIIESIEERGSKSGEGECSSGQERVVILKNLPSLSDLQMTNNPVERIQIINPIILKDLNLQSCNFAKRANLKNLHRLDKLHLPSSLMQLTIDRKHINSTTMPLLKVLRVRRNDSVFPCELLGVHQSTVIEQLFEQSKTHSALWMESEMNNKCCYEK